MPPRSPSRTADAAPRVLCFDLMDTVLVDPFRVALERATGLPLRELLGVKSPDAWVRFERGEIDEETYFGCFYREGYRPPASREELRERLVAELDRGYAFQPGMEGLLEQLRARYPLYLLSNYPVWIEKLRRRFSLDRFFAGLFVSTYLGVRKPDPEFYRRFLAASGHRASRCVLIDDRAGNLEPARALGMDAILFRGVVPLVAELCRIGVRVES